MKPANAILPHQARGYALVMVLSILVLLIGLIVGFLSLAGGERKSARGALDAVKARVLAENAVGLVQTQINRATARAATHPWVSQPGMARMFNPDGTLLAAYKLYSAADMVSGSVDKAADLPPAAWFDHRAVWVDLNRPVAVDDPANPGAKIPVYPIASPNPGVEAGSFTVNGTTTPTQTGANANPLPMPVRWLYVLQDGTFVAPTGSGSSATVAGETDANPIVGRVAFWTDDDSCKVNINTASEGQFWDTPRTSASAEIDLANYQPTQGEFQRYPGHPAMTSLSTIFPTLSAAEIQRIVPRTTPGGSNNGTTSVVSSAIIPRATDRLLPDLDELLFRPTGTATARDRESALTAAEVQNKQFFLTASSRAPEVNLFGMPRMAIWPVYRNLASARTTAFDRLIAHCATVAAGDKTAPTKYPYYFQREKSDDATNDIGLDRNVKLLAYLTALTGRSVPGFGGSLFDKYSFAGERDQILTEIFDYIRCANLTDAKLEANSFTPYFDTADKPLLGANQVVPSVRGTTRGFGRTQTLSELAIAFICTADADVEASNGGNGTFVERPGNPDKLTAGQVRVQAILIPEFFCVAAGFAGMRNEFTIRIEGAGSLQLAGQPLAFTNNDSMTFDTAGNSNTGGTTDWRYALIGRETTYPFISAPVAIAKTNTKPAFTGGNLKITIKSRGAADSSDQVFKLVMPDCDIPLPTLSKEPTTGQWWDFRGTGKRIATIAKNGFFFPGVPFVDTVRSIVPRGGDTRLVAARSAIDDWAASSAANRFFIPHPLYESTSNSTTGTLRAALLTKAYGDDYQVVGFRDSDRTFFPPPALPGPPTALPGLTMGERSRPDFLPKLVAAGNPSPNQTGDFDTGVGLATDGAFINKPDEGSVLKDLAFGANSYFWASYMALRPYDTFFSPNRQMPSPVMFGSLPTGVKEGIPWKTLLFRPQGPDFPTSGEGFRRHPSYSSSYPDHLLLDLFWMPVVEPYAISDPFSTSGKINMNYEILPFTYIERPTALHALLKSERVSAIPDTVANTYKDYLVPGGWTPDTTYTIRLPIDIPETLTQFQDRFDSTKGVFLTASQICDLHIVPTRESASSMVAFWNKHRLTGDNLKERIYANLYPRLTTRSNTFTVHMIAQSLRRPPGFTAGSWTETSECVASEYRGSTTIERFLPDVLPTTGTLAYADFAAAANAGTLFTAPPPVLDDFYRWRTIRTKTFAP